MDELVGVAAGVPRQRHGRAGDGAGYRAVLLQEEGKTNEQESAVGYGRCSLDVDGSLHALTRASVRLGKWH
jgi:hypothetical protein